MRSPFIAFLLLAASCAMAAEPVVTDADLPRVAATAPKDAVATCAVHAGFHLELMAAEPQVESPVAMAFDENGRLYVVEMRDYPERLGARLGRVKLLEDTKGDGHFDKVTIFADELSWPTGICCWDGGVFVLTVSDLLYLKDTKENGHADVHAMIFRGFGNLTKNLNVQALPNSLQWGPDQRIHGALGGNASLLQNFAQFNAPKVELRGRDFSFDPRLMDLRAESGGGQFGLTFDDAGRKYVCANSRHLMQVMYENRVAAQVTDYPLPAPAIDIAADGPQAEVFRRSPEEPWRVLRTQWRLAGAVKGPVEGGRASGYFTSASGVTIYRGDAWPAEYRGDVFIAECAGNLVHHKKLTGNLVMRGTRAPGEEKSEFVASTDNWFRPVALANAPDGNLWVADMYRETIEHPESLPASLKAHLDLNSGWDRGRIYRIVADGSIPRPAPALGKATTPELVALLEHPNGWHRETAARLLHQRQEQSAAPAIAALAANSKSPAVRLLALLVLRGLGTLDHATLDKALHDPEDDVRAGAVRVAALIENEPEWIVPFVTDPSPRVRAEASWALVTLAPTNKVTLLASLLERADDPWLRHAALAAAGNNVEPVLAEVAKADPARAAELRSSFSGKAMAAAKTPDFGPAAPRADAIAKYQAALALRGDAAKGRATFESRCVVCHRFENRGNNVGPDLDSVRQAGREKILGNILEPSREITAGYAMGIVETKNGETLAGVLANETPAGVELHLPGGVQRLLRAADILKIDHSPRSLMPDGIETGLSVQDMADLLEYLSGGSKGQ